MTVDVPGKREIWIRMVAIGLATALAGLATPFLFGEGEGEGEGAGAGDGPAAFDEGPSLPEPSRELGGLVREPADAASQPTDAHASAGTGGSAQARAVAAPTEPRSDGSVVLTASDVGVTPDVIRVGFLLVDVGGVARLGLNVAGGEVEDQRLAYRAFVDEVNASGGVLGRKIEPVFHSYDSLNREDTARAACIQFAVDDEVFAVVSFSLFGTSVLCFTAEHQLPFLNGEALPRLYFQRSGTLLFTTPVELGRSYRNQVIELDRLGVLGGKRIGVLTSESGDTHVAVEDGLLPTLERLGHRVVHYSRLPADSSSASQIPVEVNQMQAKGVDFVFVATNVIFATQFAQQAESQRYRPLYATNDLGPNTADSFLANMPASFQAVGITAFRTGERRADLPEPAFDAGCRRTVEQARGEALEREEAGYRLALTTCTHVRLLVAAATGAGPNLTRPAWTGAMQALGAFDVGFAAGGSFRPGKFDAPDHVRTLRADMTCKCWRIVGGFRPAPT